MAANDLPTPSACPFCGINAAAVTLSNESALAVRDGFPVSRGHTLVVPRLHVTCLFDLPSEVQAEVWKLVAEVRGRLSNEFHPDGFNVGLNDGRAAGQTVMHAHVHIIPRYIDDLPDPRGGVRWVVPAKAAYWEGQTK